MESSHVAVFCSLYQCAEIKADSASAFSPYHPEESFPAELRAERRHFRGRFAIAVPSGSSFGQVRDALEAELSQLWRVHIPRRMRQSRRREVRALLGAPAASAEGKTAAPQASPTVETITVHDIPSKAPLEEEEKTEPLPVPASSPAIFLRAMEAVSTGEPDRHYRFITRSRLDKDTITKNVQVRCFFFMSLGGHASGEGSTRGLRSRSLANGSPAAAATAEALDESPLHLCFTTRDETSEDTRSFRVGLHAAADVHDCGCNLQAHIVDLLQEKRRLQVERIFVMVGAVNERGEAEGMVDFSLLPSENAVAVARVFSDVLVTVRRKPVALPPSASTVVSNAQLESALTPMLGVKRPRAPESETGSVISMSSVKRSYYDSESRGNEIRLVSESQGGSVDLFNHTFNATISDRQSSRETMFCTPVRLSDIASDGGGGVVASNLTPFTMKQEATPRPPPALPPAAVDLSSSGAPSASSEKTSTAPLSETGQQSSVSSSDRSRSSDGDSEAEVFLATPSKVALNDEQLTQLITSSTQKKRQLEEMSRDHPLINQFDNFYYEESVVSCADGRDTTEAEQPPQLPRVGEAKSPSVFTVRSDRDTGSEVKPVDPYRMPTRYATVPSSSSAASSSRSGVHRVAASSSPASSSSMASTDQPYIDADAELNYAEQLAAESDHDGHGEHQLEEPGVGLPFMVSPPAHHTAGDDIASWYPPTQRVDRRPVSRRSPIWFDPLRDLPPSAGRESSGIKMSSAFTEGTDEKRSNSSESGDSDMCTPLINNSSGALTSPGTVDSITMTQQALPAYTTWSSSSESDSE